MQVILHWKRPKMSNPKMSNGQNDPKMSNRLLIGSKQVDQTNQVTGPRTNNRVAQLHKRISRKAHPNLYEILELFQQEQAATEVAIQQLEAGGVQKPKRKVICEDKIKSLAVELIEKDILI